MYSDYDYDEYLSLEGSGAAAVYIPFNITWNVWLLAALLIDMLKIEWM